MLHSEEFRTSETSLAAYLISLGFELQEIQYEQSRAFFVFENNDEALAREVKKFQILEAKGNIVAYENARRTLLSKIKRGLPQ